MKTYVTFGQDHVHRIHGVTFDADCVALVEGDRARVFEIFGSQFCFEYSEEHFDFSAMHYYPRGIIPVGELVRP